MLKGESLFRNEIKPSQIVNKKMKILINEINDPIDDAIFQVV